MKKEELMNVMSEIDDRYLDEAWNYEKREKKVRRVPAARWIAAAAVLTVVFSASAVAENLGWGQQIRTWLGIGESQQVEGFADYTGSQADETSADATAIQSEDGLVTLLSSFVSGNRVIAFFSVNTEKDSQISAEEPWTAVFPCDDPDDTEEREFYESFLPAEATVKSRSENEIVLQVTAVSEQLKTGRDLNVTLIHGNMDAEAPILDEYETVAVPLTESPVLHTSEQLAVHNDMADADGTITDIAVSAGNIELTVNEEYAENWCTRVCVPDRAKSFMERYTGSAWEAAEPEDEAYFTAADEQAVFAAYADTWDQALRQLVGSMKIHMKDGTAVSLEEPQEQNYSYAASTAGSDAEVYRWELDPVLELDQVEAIELNGTVYKLK